MKLFIGWVATASVLVTGAAEAQVPAPYRLGMGAAVTVSDVGGPYAALPPDLPPGYGQSRYAPAPYTLSVLPPREIFAIARETGFEPLGVPQQRGLVYTLSAINVDGEDGRLVIDARTGRILRFMPAYRLRDRMGEETVVTYGPAAAMPELPQYRRPQPGVPSREGAVLREAAPRVASRTPAAVPLPKKSPAKAVATPAKPVTPAVPVAVTPPVAAPAAPVEQQAVVAPKPDEVRVIPMTATPPAATETPAAPTVAAPATEAKPATPPAAEVTPAAPPVQGVE